MVCRRLGVGKKAMKISERPMATPHRRIRPGRVLGMVKSPPERFYRRLAPLAQSSGIPESDLRWIAQDYFRSHWHAFQMPGRAHANVALRGFAKTIGKFCESWRLMGMPDLLDGVPPMPSGPGNTYLAWLWLGDTALRIGAVARWRGGRGGEKRYSNQARAHYRALSENARKLYMAIVALDPRCSKEVLYRMPLDRTGAPTPTGSMKALAKALLTAATGALKNGQERSGPDPRTDILGATDMLARSYESSTGRRFTHTPYADLNCYLTSDAGMVVRGFFQVVDRRVEERLIGTAMTRVVKARNISGLDSPTLA
jgi:hypothetical protein